MLVFPRVLNIEVSGKVFVSGALLENIRRVASTAAHLEWSEASWEGRTFEFAIWKAAGEQDGRSWGSL